jgi:hypothetical protein
MPNLGQSFDPRRVVGIVAVPIGGLAQITANAFSTPSRR